MGFGIKLKVWGEYACFTRPEMKAERVSYDVMTPSAARGVLEAIHWKPAIKWVVDKIHVLKKPEFTNIRRNEVSGKMPEREIKNAMQGKEVKLYLDASSSSVRQQRAAMVLKNPVYIIEAHFEMTKKAGEGDSQEKHYNMFLRRARDGQCFHRPYLGCREFPADFELIEEKDEIPQSDLKGVVDLGWMLFDMEFLKEQDVGIYDEINPVFFRAEMKDGTIDVAKQSRAGVKK